MISEQTIKKEPLLPQEYETMYQVEDSYWWYCGVREIACRILERYLPQKTMLKILDGGCGTGGNLATLGRFGKVFGVEMSKLAGSFLQKRAFKNFALGSVTQIPFRSDAFDLVTALYVNECLTEDLPAFSEYLRILKPGGFLYVAEVAFESLRGEHDLAVGIIRRYRKNELNEKLRKSGFEVVRSSYYNTILFLPILIVRKIRNIFFPPSRPEKARSDFRLAPTFLHAFFKRTLFWEASLLKYVNLPFGVSVFTLARKPSQ